MMEFVELGKKIYNMGNPREVHRMLVFVARAQLHREGMRKLWDYFLADDWRRALVEESPFPLEQVTRAFFYHRSTFAERAKLIREHLDFLQERVQPDALLAMSSCAHEGHEVWRAEEEGKPWRAVLQFEPGQRKEGLLSLEMNLGEEHLYQMMFWFAKNAQGEDALHIGAMQGPNMEDAKEVIKRITKRCYGYRTKNLILYMLQAVARPLGVRRIYAVTNAGYYANNHVRRNRKLKTNFEEFWQEAGGHATDDPRFYELPLAEPRKSLEEVKSQKRNLYRKRFAFLDAIDEEIGRNMRKIQK